MSRPPRHGFVSSDSLSGRRRGPRGRRAISARIESAVSGCVSAPMSRPQGPRSARALLGDARLEQPLAAALLVAARAERADVERLGLERALQRGDVELVVVREHDDRRLVVGRDLRERLLRPRDDQLVRARDPLAPSRTSRARRRRSSASRAASPPRTAPRRCRPRRRRAGAAAARRSRRTPSAAAELEDAVAVLADQLVGLVERLLRHAVAEPLAALDHEHVRAERLALDHGEEDRALLALDGLRAAGRQRVTRARSTKTSISPPQGRPTDQACSSAIPYERSCGVPARAPRARSRRRRDSTQPPETEPPISPLSETASFAPTGRGAERRVATTVAIATFSPSARQRSMSARISFTPRASSRCRRGRRPALRGWPDCARQEPVDVRQRGAHAAGERLVVRMALERVDPDDRVRLPGEPRHLAADDVAASSRSQPSETITTTAPRVSARRPHTSLNAFSDAPIRVPPGPVDDALRRPPPAPPRDRGCRARASAGSGACRTRTPRRRAPSRRARAGRAAAPARTPPSSPRRRRARRACAGPRRGCGTLARSGRRPCASEARTSRRRSRSWPRGCGAAGATCAAAAPARSPR